jgi:hypothetical protein
MTQPASVHCKKCGKTRPLSQVKPITRAAEGHPGVYDVGFICPGCNEFYHAAYTNDKLMRLQRQANLIRYPTERAKLLRGYKRKFDAFQAEMETAKETEGTS